MQWPGLLDDEVLRELNVHNTSELQYILNRYGPNLGLIHLTLCQIETNSLNLSRCVNAQEIIINNQARLQRIQGLERCSDLSSLDLAHCRQLDKAPLITSLQVLKRLQTLNIIGSNLGAPNDSDRLYADDLQLLGRTHRSLTIYVHSMEYATELVEACRQGESGFLLGQIEVEEPTENVFTGSASFRLHNDSVI